MNKKYWFGHSLVWIGVLSNSPDAIAEASSPNLDPATQATQAATTDGIESVVVPISAPEAIGSIERSNWKPFTPPKINPADSQTAATEAVDDIAEGISFPSAPDSNGLELNGFDRPDELAIEPDPVEPAQSSQAADSANSDPELGRLRLRERALSIEQEDVDTVFLRGRFDYFTSDNILLDDVDPISDQFGRAGLAIVAIPQLGSNTQLLAAIGGNFAFYGDLSELNYSNLELRAEVRQTIFPNTFATIGWSNRQFFSAEDGDRFLNNHALRLALSRRDSIAERLSLNSYYQLRFNFSDPIDRSRLTNTIGASLSYALEPDLDLELSYQLDLTDFTQRDRNDTYHQVTAQLSYDLTRNSRVSLYGGFSFGESSNADVDFDSSIVGVSFSTYLPLF